jgi:phosphohistidine swiveling domain-containing protein
LPQTLAAEFHRFYRKFSGSLKDKPLNVFSSSVGEKSVIFDGISGDANLLFKIKKIWSESFRRPTAIAVQEEIKPEIKGKILTNNPLPDKKLAKQQASRLMNYCKLIQRYFYFPKEIEYIIKNDITYITRIYPFTGIVESEKPVKEKKVLARGIVVNPGIVTGPVRVFSSKLRNGMIKKGEIVVLPKLDRSIFGEIKKAKAAVVGQVLQDPADKALYRRDFRIPTVEGVDNAEIIFHNGNVITVNGVNGEIYSGGLI